MSMTASELLEAALDGTLQDDDAPNEQPDASTEGVPAAAAPEGQDKQDDASTETEVEGAPILSKSGAYTIPYEKLAEAREARKAAQDRIAQLEQQVAELTGAQQRNLAAVQADAQDRANAGQAQTALPTRTSPPPHRRWQKASTSRCSATSPKRIWQRASPS
jgi:hypothetical protein